MLFPLILSFDEVAALPGAADAFGWDDSMADDDTLPDHIASYCTATTPKLTDYLANIGYTVTDTGITIRNEQAIYTASALFNQILFEYDDIDAGRIEVTRYGYTSQTTATWALFELGGDDDVDYNGSQPSCLTDLLLSMIQPSPERYIQNEFRRYYPNASSIQVDFDDELEAINVAVHIDEAILGYTFTAGSDDDFYRFEPNTDASSIITLPLMKVA